jgi:hypothetical protein
MTVKEIDDIIQKVFDKDKVLVVDNVYEKDGDGYKLVIVIHKYMNDDDAIIYTKLIFPVDIEKIKLLKDSFLYLYDINCNYRNVEFNDVYDLEIKLKDIFNNIKFGKDLKFLTDIIIPGKYEDEEGTPLSRIKIWCEKNDISDPIKTIDYTPYNTIVSCENLSFDYTIKTVENQEIKIKISKLNDNEYRYDFIYPNDSDIQYRQDLSDIERTIVLSLENKLKNK